jgi:1,4-dihydroxy-2-naphthoate octaprenyltransferase
MMQMKPNSPAAWWKAARFHFVPPSYLPAFLGGIAAWALTKSFYLSYFILTVTGVVLNHIALNMTDDYFDFRHSVDLARNREKNPYSGGSGVLTSGLLTPAAMRRVLTAFYVITIAIGVFLAAARGWQVLIFVAFGIACSYFYTAPPVRYGYWGLGELSQLVNFSLTIGLGSFFVQAQRIAWEAAWAVLPLGFMMFSMITINEIPDELDDRRGNKRTLVVRFGPRAAIGLYALGMVCAYLIIIVAPLAGAATRWMWLGAATIPLFLRGFSILCRHYRDAFAMSPANMITIRVHNLTGILLIVAYVMRGAGRGLDVREMALPLLMLTVLYAPVAFAVFRPAPGAPAGGRL